MARRSAPVGVEVPEPSNPLAKTLVAPAGVAADERDEDHMVTRTVGTGPSSGEVVSVKRHECAPEVLRGKLLPSVEDHRHRPPVRRKSQDRELLRRAAADDGTVSPVLGREHLLILQSVVIAVRPAVVLPLPDPNEFLGGNG